jgi:CHAD domain-containing protein
MKNRIKTLSPLSKKLAKLERDFFAVFNTSGDTFKEEEIHKLRIRIRKLAAVFEIIRFYHSAKGLNKIEKHFKIVFNDLQELRDKQVQIGMVTALSERYPELKEYLHGLTVSETLLRNKAWKSMQNADINVLRSDFEFLRNAALNISLDGSPECANIAFRKAMTAKNNIDRSRIRTIHRYRIEFKKFRYIVEALADTLEIGKSAIARMGRYQDRLGLVQDLDVLSRHIKNFRKSGSKIDKAIQEIERRKSGAVDKFLRHVEDVSGFWKHRVESWITQQS